MKKIKFNTNCKSKHFVQYFELLQSDYDLFRNKHFSNLCLKELSLIYSASDLFLTHSATGALEIVATLTDIMPGDEIIMPSFTFVSTANAFVGKGAVPVFVDIKAGDLNLDESLVEQAITSKTKAIVAVHYAGHPCNLKELRLICDKHDLFLIEDAAMGFGSSYEGHPLGSYGDFGVISFDITKHVSAIQGGLLLVNNEKYKKRAKNVYHIGTNRDAFQNGEVPHYDWVDHGSKYQMNELNAAYLYDQLLQAEGVMRRQNELSNLYFYLLNPLRTKGHLQMMPEEFLKSNFHEFYIVLSSEKDRTFLKDHLIRKEIEAFSHYEPLHLSEKGRECGINTGCSNTESLYERLLRLPLNSELSQADVRRVFDEICNCFEK